MDINALAVPV